ncbi:hypothetical protein J5N97_010344 [Dioscorea zingiberensis]|uniref:DUF7806 domain-containing protein n=1 Tax=Dioscorea zingiberensis TaxID=325984 RepID=A0A9D5D013_9LILI|nr:hypothetical protein J5N97_010344 [Dioscorea zingiberensis]
MLRFSSTLLRGSYPKVGTAALRLRGGSGKLWKRFRGNDKPLAHLGSSRDYNVDMIPKMEQLNAKLYAKYQNLKKRKGFEDDEWFHKLESDLRKSKLATEDMLGDLENENDRLRAQISSMQNQYDECQKLLFEERQKMREMSNEIGRLQDLLTQRIYYNDAALSLSPHTSPASSRHISDCSPRNTVIRASPFGCSSARSGDADKTSAEKKRQNSRTNQIDVHCTEATTALCNNNQKELIMVGSFQPDCCRGNLMNSRKVYHNCLFQTFLEHVVGMEFSVRCQEQGVCFSVIHPMSGYKFSLSWIGCEDGREGELMYCVSSLGTLERVALDWMKEDMIFSMRMCPVFFEKISRVIGHQ